MKNKKKILIPLVLALVVGTLIYLRLQKNKFRYAGTVEAVDIDLSPRVASTIASVNVHEGDKVKRGQLLVELACEDLKLAAGIAERDFARAEKLYKEGSTPFEAFDRLRNRRDSTALSFAWCQITSPSDGTVLARLREPGEWVSPGAKLLTLSNLDEIYAYIYVAQPVLHSLRLGQEVKVYLPEAGNEARKGRISFIRPEAEFTPKNVQTREERTRLVFGVKIAIDNNDGVLKPGMPVEVSIQE